MLAHLRVNCWLLQCTLLWMLLLNILRVLPEFLLLKLLASCLHRPF